MGVPRPKLHSASEHPCQAASVRGQSNQVLSEVLRAGRASTAGLSPLSTPDSILMYYPKLDAYMRETYADLQNKGVRCWFAPHDMAIGAKIIDAIDEAIRLRDKVLLILSEHSVASDWVEEEVTRALAEERSRKTTVLFPIRVDDAVLNTDEAWARGLRIQRNIGNFCLWKDHDAYQKVLERVLRDLKVAQAGP